MEQFQRWYLHHLDQLHLELHLKQRSQVKCPLSIDLSTSNQISNKIGKESIVNIQDAQVQVTL